MSVSVSVDYRETTKIGGINYGSCTIQVDGKSESAIIARLTRDHPDSKFELRKVKWND